MDYQKFELKKINSTSDEYELIIYIADHLSEFAEEFGSIPKDKKDIVEIAKSIIKERYPAIKVKVAKVIIGGIAVTTIPLMGEITSAKAASPSNYSVQSNSIYYSTKNNDTLWNLSQKYNTTVDNIKRANKLSSDVLQVNQQLIIPKSFHTVNTGDYLTVLAKNYNTTVDGIRQANNLTSDNTRLGQTLIIPMIFGEQTTVQSNEPATPTPPSTANHYTVLAGDSLSVIARNLGVTINDLKKENNLTSDVIRVGQVLAIPSSATHAPTPSPTQPATPTTSNYTVVAGDSLSVIARNFGITIDDLKRANSLISDAIRVGQVLAIPSNATHAPAPSPTQPVTPTTSNYTVVAGDSLSVIARNFGITIDDLKRANSLTSDAIRVGQVLAIPSNATHAPTPSPVQPTTTNYTVVAGDYLWSVAQRFGTSVSDLKSINNLTSDVLQIGQTLQIPSTASESSKTVTEERKTFTYYVKSGDTLSLLSKQFSVTVDSILSANLLRSDILQIGQALSIPDGLNAPSQASAKTITYTTHTVVAGDNIWDLSVKYRIPQLELLRANNLSTNNTLSIGQKLTIPVHHIPVKEVVSSNHGEYLDWWTEAQYIFTIGKKAKVTDLITGKSFYIQRTIGANHADSETVSASDTNIAKSIWGGFSWNTRAVILEIDGRKLAASMSFMPHEREYIANNGITGHFDVYFANSTRHADGKPDPLHQAQVERAAGLTR
ncbi:LysM peptidoglycan-binding domain-containing protein [Niallia sp. JL1B1071]|uniref:muramidase family protein n=1 Tax=Niallia tiangongensis TaxID=3237105 RepID=UPI0037DDA913